MLGQRKNFTQIDRWLKIISKGSRKAQLRSHSALIARDMVVSSAVRCPPFSTLSWNQKAVSTTLLYLPVSSVSSSSTISLRNHDVWRRSKFQGHHTSILFPNILINGYHRIEKLSSQLGNRSG